MALETYSNPEDLYLARGVEVPAARPAFTGDVFNDVAIPGVQDKGMAMVVAHPCSIRGAGGELLDRIPVAAVTAHQAVRPQQWATGFFDRMPLPDLVEGEFHAARLTLSAPVEGDTLSRATRIACLSAFGINVLQQRMIWHLTRFEVPTHKLHEAFSHTLEEADLLEEWVDRYLSRGLPSDEATAAFEDFIRSPADGDVGPTLQDWLSENRNGALRYEVA